MGERPTLYDEDFVRWSAEQAAALRQAAASRVHFPLDWENLAEEIDSLGKSERRELASRIATILEHLLKLEFSSASEPRDGWAATVLRERGAIKRLLADNPSLRPTAPQVVDELIGDTVRIVALELGARHELSGDLRSALAARRYRLDDVLGGWLPLERHEEL